MGDPDQFRDLRLVAARDRNLQMDREIEISALLAADADVGGDRRLSDRHLSFPRHAQKSILETGGVARGEQLLRVGGGAAWTSKFLR